MANDQDLRSVIAEKSGLLNELVQRKFGSNPEATALSGQENKTGGTDAMKVTRSDNSGAPGEVRDGKLVNVNELAASAARSDIPATDLLALARANDPYSEDNIPTTIASAVMAANKGLPGQEVVPAGSTELGDIDKEVNDSLHSKQHPAVEKAVDTKVESQVSDKDPYKTLHAASDIDAIVARARALVSGGEAIKALAGDKNPGVGTPEDGGQGKAGGDASKDPAASAKTLGDGGKQARLNNGTSRKDILAAIRAEITKRQAKVEGALEDPVSGGSDAAKTPEESARTMGDGGKRTAETKDRPLASMPDHKPRYTADEDNRDKEAKDYFTKNKADEARFDREPKTDRPITKELQEKLPALAMRRLNLITRLAGLATVLAAEDGEAARLHFKKQTYKKDTAEDMDFAGAAGRTKSEINQEHGKRSSDSGSLSPMMSRLWSAIGPVKTAAVEGFKGEIAKPEGKSEAKKQVAEMQKAMKGLKAEDSGSNSAMGAMETKVEKMECDLAKASGVALGQKSIVAIATAQNRLAVIAKVLGDVSRLCKISHMEVRFAMDKPHGTGVSDDSTKLLEELGETAMDMEDAIDSALKDMGHPGLKEKGPLDEKPGDEMGAPEGGLDLELPPAPDKKGLPAAGEGMPDLGAGSRGRVKTAFEIEDERVERVAANETLSKAERQSKINGLRAGAKWTAAFNKVASAADASKPDMVSSYWEVLRGSDVVLKVSAADAYPVKTASEQSEAFAWFATKDYGMKLLASAKFEGLGKTAKVLGLSNVRTAAGAFQEYSTKRPAAPKAGLEGKPSSEKDYYSKEFGSSEFASELLKEHKKKADAEKADLLKKLAEQTNRNDRLQGDIAMRAKAARSLELAAKAMTKGMFGVEHKASFIDGLMLGDDNSFKLASTMVENFKPVVAAKAEIKVEAALTAKDLLRIASKAPGLKTAIITESASSFGLSEQLGSMWRTPPAAK